MGLDESEDIPQAITPFTRVPRSRQGTRAALRATYYTMPPLEPKAQQGVSFLGDAQNQEASASYTIEPLTPMDDDAWLNDALTPSRSNNLPEGKDADVAPVIPVLDTASDTNDDQGEREGSAASPFAKDDYILRGHRLWPVVYSLSERVRQELGNELANIECDNAGLEELVRKYVLDTLRAEPALSFQIYNLPEAERVMQGVFDETLGCGPLAALLRDEFVTEIMAVGPRFTVIERDGDMLEVPFHFEDEQHMTRIVGNILRSAGRVFDPSIAMTSVRLLDGTFVSVVMPPRAVKGPAITLRKRRKSVPTLAELVDRETLSQPMADFLQMCVRARQNIVICGGLRSGRTTLLNALAACIPDTERIVTLEDLAELQLHQKQVVSLEARVIEPGSAREHESMCDLLQCALRMRPERLIMGDCWNDEAGVLLSALYTGYDGSLFNIYANGLQDCLSRLEMMWLASRSAASLSVVREQLARAVNLVVYLARLSDGPRKVMNIAEVIGVQGDRIKARSLFHYLESGDGQGSFEPGYRVSSSSFLNSSR